MATRNRKHEGRTNSEGTNNITNIATYQGVPARKQAKTSEKRKPNTGYRIQTSRVNRCTDHREQSTEHRAQSTENRKQKTENRKQNTEYRNQKQKTEDKGQSTDPRPGISFENAATRVSITYDCFLREYVTESQTLAGGTDTRPFSMTRPLSTSTRFASATSENAYTAEMTESDGVTNTGTAA